jgi:hypothetical protein
MNRRFAPALTLLLPLLADPAGAAAGAAPGCGIAESALIRGRFDDAGPAGAGFEARIAGSGRFALELREARSGALLWTAGATSGALLQVPGMDAAILARPVPLDLDGDGWHDRVYAADVAGRIWRLDLTPGAARDHWARALQFADLSGGGLRGFLAAPDIALQAASGRAPWLSIALGSVSFENQAAANRFYVLRDSVSGSDADDGPAPSSPLRDVDLRIAEGVLGIGALRDDERLRGFYLPLGAAQVLAPSLTVDGVVVFTAALVPTTPAGGCAANAAGMPGRIEVHAVAARDGALAFDLNADGSVDGQDALLRLEGARTADSGLHVADVDDADAPGRRSCLVGTNPVPGCSLDTRLRRRYWLREDAD